MYAREKENIPLHRSLANSRGETDRVRKFDTYVGGTQCQITAHDNEVAAPGDENANLRSMIQQQEKELGYHENYNDSS